jgi:hypothetical protein
MDFEFDQVFHIVDSTIVQAQIQKESYGFGTFTATRVAEIQSKTKPEEWWWVPGEYNLADITTRVTSPCELDLDSTWQKGPSFLGKPVEEWPIMQNCHIEDNELPDTCQIIKITHTVKSESCVGKNTTFNDVNIDNFRSFIQLLRVTCIIMRICKNKGFCQNALKVSPEELQNAEKEWIRYVQTEIRTDWRTAYRRLGVQLSKDGIIVVGSRMVEWLKSTWNQTEFVLLPPKSKYTELYMRSVHNMNHAGVEYVLAKIRSKYWIPGARRFLKLVARQCVVCRKKKKAIHSQIMGSLPE